MELNEFIKVELHQVNNNIEEKFNSIAKKIMNEYQLVIGHCNYRLTEIEFYYHSEIHKHSDENCHKDDKQLNFNKWYFHGSGLDLAFGDKEKNIYFGILIRGIKNITADTDHYVSGPLNVVQEIFDQIGQITSKETRFFIEKAETPFSETPVKSTRINLPKKEDEYFNSKYRYLTDINSKHKFAEKTKVANAMLDQGYTKTDINTKLFGYKIIPD